MRKNAWLLRSVSILAVAACLAASSRARARRASAAAADATGGANLVYPGEKHLANIRQLTFGGQNAEAYFSADDKYLSLSAPGTVLRPKDRRARRVPMFPATRSTRSPVGRRTAPARAPKMISNGKGRTTCSYFFPGNARILYSSTFAASEACPPPPDYSHGYVWAINNTYTIYIAKPDGSDHSAALQSDRI